MGVEANIKAMIKPHSEFSVQRSSKGDTFEAGLEILRARKYVHRWNLLTIALSSRQCMPPT